MCLPLSPTNLAINAITSSQITLSWADNSSNESGFRIERCTDNSCSRHANVYRYRPEYKYCIYLSRAQLQHCRVLQILKCRKRQVRSLEIFHATFTVADALSVSATAHLIPATIIDLGEYSFPVIISPPFEKGE